MIWIESTYFNLPILTYLVLPLATDRNGPRDAGLAYMLAYMLRPRLLFNFLLHTSTSISTWKPYQTSTKNCTKVISKFPRSPFWKLRQFRDTPHVYTSSFSSNLNFRLTQICPFSQQVRTNRYHSLVLFVRGFFSDGAWKSGF